MRRNRFHSQRGMATIEFTGVALVLMAVAFAIVEFGSLIQAQAVVTNVTREGGSLASRDLKSGTDLFALMEGSTWPLNFACPSEEVANGTCTQADRDKRFKIYIARVEAGENSGSPDPVCMVDESGSLVGIFVESPADDPHARCNLPQDLWDLLTYEEDLGQSGAAALSQLTVVKIYYHHDPLTPLVELLNLMTHLGGGSIYNFDGSGTIPNPPELAVYDSFLISSKSVF